MTNFVDLCVLTYNYSEDSHKLNNELSLIVYPDSNSTISKDWATNPDYDSKDVKLEPHQIFEIFHDYLVAKINAVIKPNLAEKSNIDLATFINAGVARRTRLSVPTLLVMRDGSVLQDLIERQPFFLLLLMLQRIAPSHPFIQVWKEPKQEEHVQLSALIERLYVESFIESGYSLLRSRHIAFSPSRQKEIARLMEQLTVKSDGSQLNSAHEEGSTASASSAADGAQDKRPSSPARLLAERTDAALHAQASGFSSSAKEEIKQADPSLTPRLT